MWQAKRHQRIRALLETFGQVSIDRIVTELGVSRETVRRDLKELEEAGALRRVHGGIVPSHAENEAPYPERTRQNLREKRAIAGACLGLVSPGQTLLIDAGSTTACLAGQLAGLSGLLVFTNSVEVANHLSTATSRARQNRTILFGGDFISAPASTCGMTTLAAIANVRADIAFSSPYGLSAADGATSMLVEEAEIARAVFASATRRILLADGSKLGRCGRISFASAGEPDHIIMDAAAQEHPHFTLLQEKSGNRIICAGAEAPQ
ncbi:DeoR/GlpR family DNA-binding transcription regulator [Pseudomonas sp. GX19020]|uniref:DeoR/GlpR family DNA-binding transcription regulator n=1 Tax=Pseudomonas sp. GX19020 TaxID=2942277 RepID=UPI00201A1D85|nr:DeoR/GlpR family DNA-binding transcription regulator [Pseudomonas sp. GX19020]MCL4067485.1 DeoR/GlpR family DNA-binding transcription regulator [Pseudomonas sp. GX19020]